MLTFKMSSGKRCSTNSTLLDPLGSDAIMGKVEFHQCLCWTIWQQQRCWREVMTVTRTRLRWRATYEPMERLKNAGPFRRFLARHNTALVWIFCGVMGVAQADFIYKTVTGKRPDRSKVLNHFLVLVQWNLAQQMSCFSFEFKHYVIYSSLPSDFQMSQKNKYRLKKKNLCKWYVTWEKDSVKWRL